MNQEQAEETIVFFEKGHFPSAFSFIFGLFGQTNINKKFREINLYKYPTSVLQSCVSNLQASNYESPPITIGTLALL